MNKPMVSVCMTSYNQAPFIAKAIESVLMQEGDFPLELIIADDASTDGTAEICKEYALRHPQKIVFCRNERNIGSMRNFIQVIKKCQGAYIAICEGDDYWTDPLKLQKQVTFLQDNKEYNICFHKIKILLPDGRLVDDFITNFSVAETSIDYFIRKGNYIHTPSVVLRNNFELPEWFYNCQVGDYPLYLLALKWGKIKYLDELMAVYRHGVGMYSSLSMVKQRTAMFMTINELVRNYPDEKIKKMLILRQKKEFLFFLWKYFVGREGGVNDLKLVTSKFISSEIKRIFNYSPNQ